MRAKPIELRLEIVEMRKIAHPDRATPDLVLVGRADPAPGRADLALARRGFAKGIEIAVHRQDERAIVGNREIVVIDAHALAFELLHLVAQRHGSSTTPLPIIDSVPDTMPEGSSESL